MSQPLPSGSPRTLSSAWGLILAIPLALATYGLLGRADANLAHAAKASAAIAILLGTLWITEALPLAATSLLPLVLFPLCGILTFKQAAAPYADNLVYVYFGGFMLALAIERWQLHRRVALHTLLIVGTRPGLLVGGIMLATALISMWISNTATTAMMLPLGLSLIKLITRQSKEHVAGGMNETDAANFATSMMLGIAYAATIGGLGTLIGTPTNTALAGFARIKGIEVGFARWMIFAIPLASIYLLFAWLLLTKWIYRLPGTEVPDSRRAIREELASLGSVSRGEWVVSIVFGCTALLWLLREPIIKSPWLLAQWPDIAKLDDGIIALMGALALFTIPIDWRRGVFALDWETANKMPWGILILFGGGLSLAVAVTESKLADWIGVQVAAYGGVSVLMLVVAVTAVIIFASEFTSNVATVNAFLPIMYGVSQGLDANPLLLMIATTIAASCAFMLPVGTPPNAIAFGTGYIRQSQMMFAGLWLNLLGIPLIPLAVFTLGEWVFGG